MMLTMITLGKEYGPILLNWNFQKLKMEEVSQRIDCWEKLYKFVFLVSNLYKEKSLLMRWVLEKQFKISFLRRLAFLCLEDRGFSFSGLDPVLIICPTTLIRQWLKGFRTWFPTLSCCNFTQ
ncbi:unnamed protein product [Brugia pahangi]|uniref:Ovule protein n=1 Tax=Brugia pahangi TaxID=6280 RepID=A0A0N4TTB6_BRUPA|nr:unnamed protein product [Brugia pahangi]